MKNIDSLLNENAKVKYDEIKNEQLLKCKNNLILNVHFQIFNFIIFIVFDALIIIKRKQALIKLLN